ncbi:TPA: PTS galactitol transporter subunit IIC, partial [Clostridioides difficile]|nr:PTS galactitol transporter subunit IIC [Clostridioides difficile]
AVNVIMILTKLTDTFDVDVFNYSVWALASSYVWAITGNVVLAIVAFVINEVVVLKFADFTAPAIQKAYGLDGISIPHGNAVIFAPIGIAVNWVIERIPVLARIDW